jgi:MFS family permease
MNAALSKRQLVAWRNAVFVFFFVTGLGFATWATRVPSAASTLRIDTFQVGVLLLVAGGSSIVSLSLANLAIARWGPRRTLVIGLSCFGFGMLVTGLGAQFLASYAVTAAGLAIMGLGMGTSDVTMNVEGAAVEQALGRTLMPLFHALFSLGTVTGAAVGVAMLAGHVGVSWHLWCVAIVVVIAGTIASGFIPRSRSAAADHAVDASAGTPRAARRAAALAVWRNPRTWAIGAILLGMTFAEGGANDWLPLSVVDGHGGTVAQGALALTVFSIAMTVLRALGGPIVDRVGRVWTLRILAVAAAAGLVVFILAPSFPLQLIGVALWGVGASLGFPLGMSAAADDPAKAAATVSAVATIGYIAFLCGPPLLGWISHHIGLLPTLWILVGLIAVSGFASGAARPIAGSTVGGGRPAAPHDRRPVPDSPVGDSPVQDRTVEDSHVEDRTA